MAMSPSDMQAADIATGTLHQEMQGYLLVKP